jgi:hypothetical protein
VTDSHQLPGACFQLIVTVEIADAASFDPPMFEQRRAANRLVMILGSGKR